MKFKVGDHVRVSKDWTGTVIAVNPAEPYHVKVGPDGFGSSIWQLVENLEKL